MGKIIRISARRERIQRRFSMIMYLLMSGALFYPWIMIGDERFNLISFAIRLKTKGAESIVRQAGLAPDPSYAGGLSASLWLYLGFAILCALYILTIVLRKDWNINIAVVLVSIVFTYMNEWEYMIGTVCTNATEAVLYPGVLLLLSGTECIGRKIIEAWDREVQDRAEHEKKEKREKEERKKRLYFPGKYNRQFFVVIWKNFVGNLKEYAVLLAINGLVFAFVMAGFGMQTVMKDADMSYKTGYPAGAGAVLFQGLTELGIVGLLMLVLLLLYYLRKRLPEYGVFKTLGIRRKTMYSCMSLELGCGAVLSLVAGGVLGVILVMLFQQGAGGESAGWFSPLLIIKAVPVMLLIYLVTFFVTHDLFVGLRMGSLTDLQMMKEWIPGRFHVVFVAAGICLAASGLSEYRKNVNGEDAEFIIRCLLGVYLVIRFGIAGYLIRQKKRGGALSKLLKQHPFYHKSRSTAWYIFGLCVLQICITALFSVQYFSACLAGDTDDLFPYDLVLIADDGDEAFLKEIREMKGAEALEYPMVRVSGSESELAGIASQNIGISESTYHALKKERDPDYQEKSLGLDAEGEKVFIVHQQDKGTEAQPIDHYDTYVPKETPVLYTGPVCEGYSPDNFPAEFSHSLTVTSYYIRQIAGEETDSLIGVLAQGERENLVVFSDAYFERAKDEWKVTNPFTGEILSPSQFEREGIAPKQGPTRLVLVKAGKEALEELELKLLEFKERHREEERYDTKVRSSYLKTEVKERVDAELRMRKIMALLLGISFFAASVLLLGIKMMTEKRMNIRRAQFLNCMGMKKAERTALLRSEMRIYYLLTVLVSGILSAGLVQGTIRARLYGPSDTGELFSGLIPFVVCEMAAFGVIVWILTEYNIRRIEKKAGEV